MPANRYLLKELAGAASFIADPFPILNDFQPPLPARRERAHMDATDAIQAVWSDLSWDDNPETTAQALVEDKIAQLEALQGAKNFFRRRQAQRQFQRIIHLAAGRQYAFASLVR
jgi:hypothetical protein